MIACLVNTFAKEYFHSFAQLLHICVSVRILECLNHSLYVPPHYVLCRLVGVSDKYNGEVMSHEIVQYLSAPCDLNGLENS